MSTRPNRPKNSQLPDPTQDALEDTETHVFSGYKAHTLFEITIAPCDAFQQKTIEKKRPTALDRLTAFHEYYKRLFGKFSQYIIYDLYVEVTEPRYGTNDPRMHLHGLFRIRKTCYILPFLLEILPKLHITGMVVISDYRPNIWPAYMIKQTDIFNNPIYLKFHNISNMPKPKQGCTTMLEYITTPQESDFEYTDTEDDTEL